MPKKKPVKKVQRKSDAVARHRARRKSEVAELKQKIIDLESEKQKLEELKGLRNLLCSPLEKIARAQLFQREQALKENSQLKYMLKEQREYAEAITALLLKKPKLYRYNEFESEQYEWKFFQLVADRTKRRRAIDQIMGREYENLNTVLLQTGLFDIQNEITTRQIIGNYPNCEFQILKHIVVPNAGYELVSSIAFNCISGNFMNSFPLDGGMLSIKNIEKIDENTNQIFIHCTHSIQPLLPNCAGNCIVKRFNEKNRVVITWRSIIQDDLYSLEPNTVQLRETYWLVFENAPKDKNNVRDSTRVKFICKCTAPISSEIAEILDQVSMSKEAYNQAILQNISNGVEALQGIIQSMSICSMVCTS